MSLEEEGVTIMTETQGGDELNGDGYEAYLNRKQDLHNRSMALPLSHFWSCKVFEYNYISFIFHLNIKYAQHQYIWPLAI